MTIATTNQDVSRGTREKAARRAKQTGEHSVVYEAKVGGNPTQLVTTLSIWEHVTSNTVKFLAVIDSDGNYVDVN